MCGLVAAITKQPNGFSKDLVDAFNALLYIDSLRGMDSTGAFLVENNGDLSWNKEAVASPIFCQAPEHKAMLGAAFSRGRALVGHNRAATRGVINDENAHPFTVDNRITLVHNGTLFGDHRKLADVEVDSHAIAHVIHENGDDVEAAMKKINGAYALIWHDYRNSTLNFLRNEQRPLHFVEVNNGYLWASEDNMLTWVLARFPNLKPTADGIRPLEAGTLVTYDFANNSWSLDVKKLDVKPPVTTTYYGGSANNYGQHYGSGRNVYANAYEDDDGETYVFGGRPACEMPQHKPQQTSTNVVRTTPLVLSPGMAATTPRVVKEEQKIARDGGFNMPCQTFMATNDSFKQGDWLRAEALDYQYVATKDNSGGYFVYGRLQRDSRYMVRIHVTPDVSETDVLDLVLNNKIFGAQINGRMFTAYHDASMGAGYAMLTATKWTRVVETAEDSSTKDTVNV